jgi:hypothetical protein
VHINQQVARVVGRQGDHGKTEMEGAVYEQYQQQRDSIPLA